MSTAPAASMRAAVIASPGAVPSILGVRRPTDDGTVLVEVEAAAVNPIDLAVASGRFHGGQAPHPYVPGAEAVGRIVTADGSRGSRVWFQTAGRTGGFAEYASADPTRVVRLPDDVMPALAVSVGIAGLTGWLAVENGGVLQAGENVVVLGATGAVGLMAVQAARALGAGRVVAVGRDEDALARAVRVGADASVRLTGDPGDWSGALRDAAQGKVDVIVDSLWGAPALAALGAATLGCRLVQVGAQAGNDVTLGAGVLRAQSASIVGFALTWGVPFDTQAATLVDLVRRAATGEIVVDYEVLELTEVGTAWERQRSSPHTKLVLVP